MELVRSDAFLYFNAFILIIFTLEARKKGPPVKRAKKGSGAAHAKGSKQNKSLSLLLAMPLDVLFEVNFYYY